jgi:hypothetical protein
MKGENEMVTIEKLTIEERHTWGKCPVCGAEHGQACKPDDINGTHIARLVNAPYTAAIESMET